MLVQDLERALIFGTSMMILNLVVGFIAFVFAPPTLVSSVAGGGAFLEIGLLLIVGGCMMSRQPIENKDRYAEDGSISSAWRIALIGRRMLLTAFILFLYTAVLSLAALFLLI